LNFKTKIDKVETGAPQKTIEEGKKNLTPKKYSSQVHHPQHATRAKHEHPNQYRVTHGQHYSAC